MDDGDWLAKRFDDHRRHLQAVALRILGSSGDAEDAVQEAWLRLSRSEAAEIDNLGGWLTTVVARVCLDLLRSRKSRREDPLDEPKTEVLPVAPSASLAQDPETDFILADSVGPALLVVLESLAPAERVAFVLHDLFDLPFREIAPIVGRSALATRQLASRARRRVRGETPSDEADRTRQKEIVTAFMAAAREGQFEALMGLLDPDVRLRADAAAVQASLANRAEGAPILVGELRGALLVADTLKGRARTARIVDLDGMPGAVWVVDGNVRAAFVFVIDDGRIAEIDVVMEPEHLGALAVEGLGA